jgi:5-methylcytosine-specific restriction endonuclease McrA
MNDLNEITEKLVATGKWGERAVRIAARSDFKCAYCDRDLLASVDNYKSWQEDHIVPLDSGGEDTEENLALSCRTCNVNIKGKWNPLTVCSDESTRNERIIAIRKYVAKKRALFLHDVAVFRCIVYGESS